MSTGERRKLKECPLYYTSYKYNKQGELSYTGALGVCWDEAVAT